MGGDTTSTTNIPPPTAAEQELTRLNGELARKQLASIDQLAPFQQQLLQAATADLGRTSTLNAALDAAVSPEQQAAAYKAEYDRNQRLGPIQEQLLQQQLDQLKQGGKATPEQVQQIRDATDASIAAGTGDINTQTKRGIGLISDELANSRGLRLSDSPITSEAALLTRAGDDQIASLTNNLRANQANAVLNYPLAVQGLQSGINQNQQTTINAAQNFQDQLRNQAYQNRLALTGQAQTGGIGLASIGNGNGALNALTNSRLGSASTNSSKGIGLSDVGSLAMGIGALAAFSDRRLKKDYGKVGELPSGIGLHVFRYKGDDTVRIGPMADEVERVLPAAVKTHSSGYKVVDYAQLR